eukprot:CCRYP_020381-RD/>CCRYP_020381-RD protein AED:0.47 eAED:0.56 QI:0/-1/0/1/-1/0/1/0/39
MTTSACGMGRPPRGLPRKCDGCGAGFTVEHGLSIKKEDW